MENNWKWHPDGKFDQCCCSCGRPVPKGRPREVLNRAVSPVDRAVLKHPACRPVILFNRWGVRIKKLAIKERW